jgi:hypothetical protein
MHCVSRLLKTSELLFSIPSYINISEGILQVLLKDTIVSMSQRVPQAIAVRKPRDHRSESDSSVTELTDLTALG